MQVSPPRGLAYVAVWRWHFLAALIVIPFVLWQATTGTLYLWSEWWMDITHPALRFVAPVAHHLPPSQQIEAALNTLPRGVGFPAQAHAHATAPPAQEEAAATASTTAEGPPILDILVADDPARSTIVLWQAASGLPAPIFIDPNNAHVLGTLTAAQWMPGWSRAMHGGWPLGRAGSWLLELGDCWAIVMILTGWYLWWPRSRGVLAALWPRWRAGPRTLARDLHASVALLFSGVFFFFLLSALPWTSFWGGEILSRVQSAMAQDSPAGFSVGGVPAGGLRAALQSVDAVVGAARNAGVTGVLSIRLAAAPGAPLFLTNRTERVADDRIVTGDAQTGRTTGDYRNDDLPMIPRLIAIGVHVHQGDFGAANVWLNTALATALIWLSGTGLASWWIRRPSGRSGIPPRTRVRWSVSLGVGVGVLCVVLPIFGASALLFGILGQAFRQRA